MNVSNKNMPTARRKCPVGPTSKGNTKENDPDNNK